MPHSCFLGKVLGALTKIFFLPLPKWESIDTLVILGFNLFIMAARKIILATNEIYHIFNRGVEKRPIFLNRKNYFRFLEITNYYRFQKSPFKFSYYKALPLTEQEKILRNLQEGSQKLVDIFSFCLLPNHIHFLLKQLVDGGISKFISKVTNSWSRYFNTRNKRIGHLFQGNFGASRIEDDEQFIHVSRYIHLNPITSCLIKIENLIGYEYSSYPEYLNKKTGFCNVNPIISFFKTAKDYERFINDQADYAKTLESIKHLVLE